MKTVLRNFLSVLRRYRLAAALNVLGLSVAFAAFMVIMMQVDYDRSFDRFHKDAEHIYRMEVNIPMLEYGWMNITNHQVTETFAASSPHIVAASLVAGENFMTGEKLLFSVEKDGIRNNFHEPYARVSSNFTGVFTFAMAEGTEKALEEPGKVLIPQSLARKCFGGMPATGQVFLAKDSAYTVGGVYKDFPRYSTLENAVYIPLPHKIPEDDNENLNYFCYLRTDGLAAPEELLEDCRPMLDPVRLLGREAKDLDISYRFTPLPEIHYTEDVRFDLSQAKTSRQAVFVLLSIAFIVLLVAGINYTNFSSALVPKRIRSINTQKVCGGTNRMIRWALVLEAAATCLFSFGLALVWLALANDTQLAALTPADMSLAAHPWLIAATVLLSMLAGAAAGIYPAFHITSFAPALALKGTFGLSPKGRQLRNVLISVQFFAAFALIITASFIYLQNRYMLKTPLGYDKGDVIVAELGGNVLKQTGALANRLESLAGIEGAAFANIAFGNTDNYSQWGSEIRDKFIRFACIDVSPTFLEVMKIQPLEGRSFRPEDANSSEGTYIFNRQARDEYGLVLSEKLDNREIVGFIPDIKMSSFRIATEPSAFFIPPAQWEPEWRYAYVRVKPGAGLQESLAQVRSALKEFDDAYPFDVRFFDERQQQMYEKEQTTGLLITLFSLVAIFISIIGVFGLVVFDSEYRRKEISIRKVFGSTTHEILLTFNKVYIRILCICFIVAAPVAWYAVTKWLESFAYKTPMYWWVYALAFAIVALITAATVTFQNWRAANMNPVEAIKN